MIEIKILSYFTIILTSYLARLGPDARPARRHDQRQRVRSCIIFYVPTYNIVPLEQSNNLRWRQNVRKIGRSGIILPFYRHTHQAAPPTPPWTRPQPDCLLPCVASTPGMPLRPSNDDAFETNIRPNDERRRSSGGHQRCLLCLIFCLVVAAALAVSSAYGARAVAGALFGGARPQPPIEDEDTIDGLLTLTPTYGPSRLGIPADDSGSDDERSTTTEPHPPTLNSTSTPTTYSSHNTGRNPSTPPTVGSGSDDDHSTTETHPSTQNSTANPTIQSTYLSGQSPSPPVPPPSPRPQQQPSEPAGTVPISLVPRNCGTVANNATYCYQNRRYGIVDDVRFNMDVSVAMKTPDTSGPIARAVERWTSVVVGDLREYVVREDFDSVETICGGAFPAVIDDLHVCIREGEKPMRLRRMTLPPWFSCHVH